MNKSFLLFALLSIACPSASAADLKMRIVWDGDVPKVREFENSLSVDCHDVDLNT